MRIFILGHEILKIDTRSGAKIAYDTSAQQALVASIAVLPRLIENFLKAKTPPQNPAESKPENSESRQTDDDSATFTDTLYERVNEALETCDRLAERVERLESVLSIDPMAVDPLTGSAHFEPDTCGMPVDPLAAAFKPEIHT